MSPTKNKLLQCMAEGLGLKLGLELCLWVGFGLGSVL